MTSETETRTPSTPASKPVTLPEISLVIPVYNEEGNLPNLYREITEVLESYGRAYEIVFIDDGSTDASFALLSALHHQDSRVRVIRFRKNFGQTAALAAGFAEALAPAIVTLDADLQNEPADIPRLVERPRRRLRYRVRLAEGSERPVRVTHPSIDDRQLVDLGHDGSASARLRLHAQGVPRGCRQAPATLWGDAPLHSRGREQHRRLDR